MFRRLFPGLLTLTQREVTRFLALDSERIYCLRQADEMLASPVPPEDKPAPVFVPTDDEEFDFGEDTYV